jgi:hypothetical protein
VAFFGATAICAGFNFVGQKFWIFRTEPVEDDEEEQE